MTQQVIKMILFSSSCFATYWDKKHDIKLYKYTIVRSTHCMDSRHYCVISAKFAK